MKRIRQTVLLFGALCLVAILARINAPPPVDDSTLYLERSRQELRLLESLEDELRASVDRNAPPMTSEKLRDFQALFEQRHRAIRQLPTDSETQKHKQLLVERAEASIEVTRIIPGYFRAVSIIERREKLTPEAESALQSTVTESVEAWVGYRYALKHSDNMLFVSEPL